MSEVENNAEVKAPVAKIDAAAEKAYAEASAKTVEAPAAPKAAAPAVKTPAAPKQAPVAKKAPVVKKAAAKTVKKKTATKTAPVKKPVLAKKAAAKTSKPAAPKTNPVIKIKDTIMATAKNADITATAKTVLADVQARAKTAATTAYAKGSELTAEATEFAKANVEAVVESGKIFAAGAQELLKDNIETGKTVFETVTEDAKKVAAVKSPTELFQLQGEIARRNFDAAMAQGSKNAELLMKLANDVFAPLSSRASVAAEKLTKAA